MTDQTDLISDLRLNHEYCPKEVIIQAADALEAAQAEIERLQTTVKHLSDAAANATFAEKAAQADVARLTTAYTVELDKVSQRNYELRIDYDAALARIAKLEPKRNVSPPSEELVLHKMRYHFWDAEDDEPADFELFDAGVECDTCIDVALVRQDRLDELIAAINAKGNT